MARTRDDPGRMLRDYGTPKRSAFRIDEKDMIADEQTRVLTRFHEATARLESLIDGTPSPADASRDAVQERATYRMGRLRRFLALLGNPHRGYPIVHVGGTSGKGSTSTLIASILVSAGYRTGLHTSPYLQTPAEKLQINGALVAPEVYVDLCDTVFAAHERWLAAGEEPITYGEAWFALTALFFRESHVDVAVLEVGAGGRFDLTNIIEPIVSVITSVGIDHTATLGSSIAEIAWHKAGIVKPGVPAVTSVSNPEALAIVAAEAASRQAPLTIVDPALAATDVRTDFQGTSWTDRRTGFRFHTALRGAFQARNGAAATAVIEALRGLGHHVSDEAVERGLQSARIPGRVEMIEDSRMVMLDGAHNVEKMGALAGDIPRLLPVGSGGQRIAVLGVLEAKQAVSMVRSLVPVMDVLVATAPRVTAKEARDASAIAAIAAEADFHGPVWIEPEPRTAIDRALDLAGAHAASAVVVTGSLYLIGNVRERWYAEDDIVLARSPWP
ncbi:MAG: bifunctional folylpolyglutamate synthase/dihydrofolate synthase [Chloroflexia bacterium]|nr:bifunctional folylpolyglutamate synthase/dihydrofolate synthase [Chloroflexia bacterium]